MYSLRLWSTKVQNESTYVQRVFNIKPRGVVEGLETIEQSIFYCVGVL
jgi:hypothetical protein